MNEKWDKLIDQPIEVEKQQALQNFRLPPNLSSPAQTGNAPRHVSLIWLNRTWIWSGAAAIVILTVTVFLMLHQTGGPPESTVTSKTIEQAFLAIQRNQLGPELPSFFSSSGKKSYSDLSWNIQSTFYRVRQEQYSRQDLGEAVRRTLSREPTPSHPVASLDKKAVGDLDVKIRELNSTKAVERVLSKHSQNQ
jgi:hypothetical protein